jgi:hypothetical protein
MHEENPHLCRENPHLWQNRPEVGHPIFVGVIFQCLTSFEPIVSGQKCFGQARGATREGVDAGTWIWTFTVTSKPCLYGEREKARAWEACAFKFHSILSV